MARITQAISRMPTRASGQDRRSVTCSASSAAAATSQAPSGVAMAGAAPAEARIRYPNRATLNVGRQFIAYAVMAVPSPITSR